MKNNIFKGEKQKMSKIDKKAIVILLILTILFTMLGSTRSFALIEVNPELENTGSTTMTLGNRALLADGSLWKIVSSDNAKLDDTNVKQYNFVYTRHGAVKCDYYAKLKNDGKLYVKSTAADDESSVINEKTISNVKKIVEQYNGDFLAYVTNNNELRYLDPYYDGGNINFETTMTDVESTKGPFVIKDGQTYFATGMEPFLPAPITSAFQKYCAVGYNLYEARCYGFYYDKEGNKKESKYCYQVDRKNSDNQWVDVTDFKRFTNTQNINGDMQYETTSGTLIYEFDYNLNATQEYYKYHAVDGKFWYLLNGKNVMYQTRKSESSPINNTVLLKNVVDMNMVNNSTIVFVRTDGSVWANTPWKAQSSTKIISPSILNFKDINTNSWYFSAVNFAFLNNILKGYNDTTFAPNDKLTRGMLVTILYRMEGEPAISGKPKFPDVQDSKKYYYKAVKWATDNEIVNGYNNGNFGPTDNIQRQQLAVILNKYAKYKGKDVSKSDDLKSFTDSSQISSYAIKQVKWAVGAGVITGNQDKKTGERTLNPKGDATRAEVAAMMQKYCKNVGI